MTEQRESQLHHVVFAVAPQRFDAVTQLFTELGFTFEDLEMTEFGVHVHLDWSGGIELISPIPGSTATVADAVNEFLTSRGDGVFTVVVGVPGASAAVGVAERYGATTRFRQSFDGDGTHLDEIEVSLHGLPLTFLSTNVP